MENLENNTPQDAIIETGEEINPVDAKIRAAKRAFVGGIVLCALSLIIYFLGIFSAICYIDDRVILSNTFVWPSVILSALIWVGLIFSIIFLIAGIKGIRTGYRTKSIIATGFGAQNCIVYTYLAFYSVFGLMIVFG